jgi:hypothetical protein
MADLNTLRNCAAPISSPQFATGAEITSSGQPVFLMSETSGTAGHALGRIIYDGGAVIAGGGWVFQKMSDAGDFAANLVTVLQNAPAIGIGALVPLSALDVNGGVAIGSYAGANSAPTNGLIVSGNVGIGTPSPSYLLHVNGTAYAAGAAGALSDIRHKKDVVPLKDGALDNVMKLRPVSFQWKAPKDDGMKGRQMGFIAQEVEKVLPSAVLTQHDAEKTKGLKYNEIVAMLTKAIQEQQLEIKALKSEHQADQAAINQLNSNQQAQIDNLKSKVASLESSKIASLK